MPQLRRALLLGNGDNLPTDFLKKLAAQVDFILATDGAADRALQSGLFPDAVIGDLDSASVRAKKRLAHIPWIFVDNQNNTDLEKALDWLVAEKFTHVTLCGFTGGRLDFTLGNFLSLYPYTKKLILQVCGPGWSLYPVTKSFTRVCTPGKRISLLPYQLCRNVQTRGLKYPLRNETLSWKQPGRTISNQTTGKRLQLSLSSGFLWLYLED